MAGKRTIQRRALVHQMKDRKGMLITTKCGAACMPSQVTVWHMDVTCFDCLNGGVSYES